MWLMDHVFKYTNFGLVSLIHGDFFIKQVRKSWRVLEMKSVGRFLGNRSFRVSGSEVAGLLQL